MKKTGLFSLGFNDFIKGLIVAILGAVVGIIKGSVDAGSLKFDWKAIGAAALIAALAYLAKNLLTNSKDQFLTKDPPQT